MAVSKSLAQGKIVVPVWSKDGVVNPLVDENGKVPVIGTFSGGDIEAQVYYYDGVNWQEWLGNPTVIDVHNKIYDGANWIDQTTKWVLQGNYFAQAINNNTGAGTVEIATTNVPANEMVLLRECVPYYVSGTVNRVLVMATQGGLKKGIYDQTTLITSRYIMTHLNVVLPSGQHVVGRFYNCAVGNDIRIRIYGELYKKE